uniref:Uncharacterized protein n=1 Tax=Acrobeloides nanus TaxID=290746 RepID=A0A914DT52_9BILA
MVRMFYNGKLHNLQYIDLSFNYLTSVPYNLPCPFPALTKIDFRQNLLQSLAMNTSCLQGIESIDLSRNHFNDLDKNFRDNFANSVPANSLLMRNSFHCDCNSADYIQWIRSTNAIREKNILTCSRASPINFVGSRLVEVPLHKLDCKTSLTSSSTGLDSGANLFYLLVLFVTSSLI